MTEIFRQVTLDGLEPVAIRVKQLIGKIPFPVVFLSGEMGAGKTTFTRVLVNLFTNAEYVNSPTFNLYNEYADTNIHIFHFDLYRLAHPQELDQLGFEEIWGKQGIRIIEWWQKRELLLPRQMWKWFLS